MPPCCRSFAECLPPLLSKAALDPAAGLLAAHAAAAAGGGGHTDDEGAEQLVGLDAEARGSSGGGADAFPTNVGPLVDMAGKKWAHTVRGEGRAGVGGSLGAMGCRRARELSGV